MFEKMLVALDGSPHSERIVGVLEPLLLRPLAELILVRVVPRGPIAHDQAAQAPAREYLFAMETRLAERGFRASSHILVGDDPAAEIVTFAAKSGASLICLSTHGRAGLRRLLAGSTAERVIRTADRPVLLVNPWVPGAPLQFRRVVVPVDGSESGDAVLPVAAELARHFGSELELVHVEELTALTPAIAVAAEHRETVRMFERMKRALGRASVHAVARSGLAADEIVAAIREASPDVVLMTTHGRTGLARVALGSVAETVIRSAPCPVLVLRSSPSLAAKTRDARTT